ncbi:MAG TPA: hypothetical protein VFZ10_01635 [Geminicoccaceae bacterium]
MKLQSILMALMVVGTAAAFAQQQALPEPPMPVLEANLQLTGEKEQEEERLLIQKLSQIENDPVARERAKAEAEVPLSAFSGTANVGN